MYPIQLRWHPDWPMQAVCHHEKTQGTILRPHGLLTFRWSQVETGLGGKDDPNITMENLPCYGTNTLKFGLVLLVVKGMLNDAQES